MNRIGQRTIFCMLRRLYPTGGVMRGFCVSGKIPEGLCRLIGFILGANSCHKRAPYSPSYCLALVKSDWSVGQDIVDLA